MLLTERFNVYDKLAKKLAKDSFAHYKSYLEDFEAVNDDAVTNLYSYSRKTFPIFYYSFPVVGSNFEDDALESKLQCIIEMSPGLFSSENKYAFNGLYNPNADYFNKKHDTKIAPDITVELHISDFEQFEYYDFDWNKFYFELLHVIRHELEHQVQHLRKEGIPVAHFDFDRDELTRTTLGYQTDDAMSSQAQYFAKLPSEVEAELKAHYFISKKTKEPLKTIVRKRLVDLGEFMDFKKSDIDYIITKWEEYRKKYFKYMPSLK